jgi:hypothetical protein
MAGNFQTRFSALLHNNKNVREIKRALMLPKTITS